MKRSELNITEAAILKLKEIIVNDRDKGSSPELTHAYHVSFNSLHQYDEAMDYYRDNKLSKYKSTIRKAENNYLEALGFLNLHYTKEANK